MQRPGMGQPTAMMMAQQQQRPTALQQQGPHQQQYKFAQTARNMPQPASQYQQPMAQQAVAFICSSTTCGVG